MHERFFPASEMVEVALAAGVADVISAARKAHRPIYPVGGATNLGMGAGVDEAGTILALQKLNRLIDYPSRDLTITVEAGMTFAELAKHLAAENQRLPIDVGCADAATVGGAVAANLSGPRRCRFGTIRDYLLGVTAVAGTGEVFSAGGRVVKNAAGYDLTRLMVGSMGTLGVMTQVTFMVRPMPERTAFLVVPLPSLEKGAMLLDEIAKSEIEPVALELIAGHGDFAMANSDALALWLGFEGGDAEVSWMLDLVHKLGGGLGLSPTRKDVPPEQVEATWQGLAEHVNAVSAKGADSTLVLEATVLPSMIVTAALRFREIDENVVLQGRAGNGVLLGRFECEPGRAAELTTKVRNAIAQIGGRVVVTSYPPESRLDQQTVWGIPGPEMRVMQRIKQQFDPEGILNPGRFIFEGPPASIHS